MRAMKGDRHKKIAMRILKSIQKAQKRMKIKSIPAHVELKGNERVDILGKNGVRNGKPIDYCLQL
jgi:ribonuclease HI